MGVIVATKILDGLLEPRNPPYYGAHTRLYIHLSQKLNTNEINDNPVKKYKYFLIGIINFIIVTATSTTNPNTHQVDKLTQLELQLCICYYE